MDECLGKGEQIFSYDDRLRSTNPVHRTNYHGTKWDIYPSLNLLIVQEKTMKKITQLWMKEWGYLHRAAKILVFHGPKVLTSQLAKAYKSWCKCVRGRGYNTVTWHVDAVKCGASLWSSYLVTFCYSIKSNLHPPLQLEVTKAVRPCKNVIRTYNIYKSQYQPISNLVTSTYLMQPTCVGTV